MVYTNFGHQIETSIALKMHLLEKKNKIQAACYINQVANTTVNTHLCHPSTTHGSLWDRSFLTPCKVQYQVWISEGEGTGKAPNVASVTSLPLCDKSTFINSVSFK